MEKRAILAILLTFFVIIFWTFIQSKFFPPPPSKTQPKEVRKGEVSPQEKAAEKKTELGESRLLKGGKSPVRRKVVPQKEVTVETQNYWAVFTSDDARLKHFKLKRYEDRVKQSVITIKLTQFVDEILGKKAEEPKKPEPLDLVNTREEKDLPLGLTLSAAGVPLDENWEVDKDQVRLLQNGQKGEITFSKSLENGVTVLKRFTCSSDLYTIKLDVEVQNGSSKEVRNRVGLEWIGKIELARLAKEGDKDYGLKYIFLRNQKVEKKEFGRTRGSGCVPSCGSEKTTIEPFESEEKGDIKWFSFGGEYFTALIVPPASEEITLAVKGSDKDLLTADVMPPSVTIPPRGNVNATY